MSSHTAQHYVPRFLLEQWHTKPDNKLSVFRWAHGQLRHSRLKARSVAKMDHLYSLWRSRTDPDVVLEREFFGPMIDDPTAIVHAKLLRCGVGLLTAEDKVVWTRFLTAQLLRVPAQMDEIRAKGREALLAQLGRDPDEYDAIRGDAPETTLLEWTERHVPGVFDDIGPRALPLLISSPLINGAIANHTRWLTVRVERAEYDLLIGDQPLVLHGTFSKGFLLALPLAPRLLFLCLNHPYIWDKVLKRSHAILVRDMNRSTCGAAAIYVYSTNDRQQPMVRRRLPKPKV